MSSIKNLDLNLLKIFDAIYVTGSVSAASFKLEMSQPSVSRGLSRLRDHFNDKLFERSGNGVAPTLKATSMIKSVRNALSLIDRVHEESSVFDPAIQERNFRLILPDPAEVRVIPHIINRLPENSQVTFEVLAYSGVDISKAFSAESVDAGVLPFVPEAEQVSYQKLYKDNGVLIARKDHPLLKDGFNFALLNELNLILLPDHVRRLASLEEILQTFQINIKKVCVTHKISSIPRIVATTDLVSFMPKDYAQSLRDSWNVDVFPIPETQLEPQNVYLLYPKAKQEEPAIKWICNEINSAYEGIGS